MMKYNYRRSLHITINDKFVHYCIKTCLLCTYIHVEDSELTHKPSRHCLSWYFRPVCDVCDNLRPIYDHVFDFWSKIWSQMCRKLSQICLFGHSTCTFIVASFFSKSRSSLRLLCLLRVMTGKGTRKTNRKAKDDRYYQK
jgi:hypothetical protein